MGQAHGAAAESACTPRLWQASDATEVGRLAFTVVAELVRARPTAVISLTTGKTTWGLYQALIAACQSGAIALSAARLVSSEEYLGVSDDDPISLFGWLRRDLLDPCGVAPAAVLRLAGDSADPAGECARFDAALQRLGGLDLVVQSVGLNGHFGFNEPGSPRDAATRVVTLAPTTRESNAAYWPAGAAVPAQALALGVRPTLQAAHVLLLASGPRKAAALARALRGPIDEESPCSLLRLAPRLTIIADVGALSEWPDHSAPDHAWAPGAAPESPPKQVASVAVSDLSGRGRPC